ncbi:MAG: response regulator [Ruminococcus sp.]|nr:response regulator [Ruminococcus sp.]
MDKENYKVLMIDDDELIARSTAEYFNILGLKTAYVTSYDAAVEFLNTHEISLLLLDINLGDRSGFDLCRRIRESYDMRIGDQGQGVPSDEIELITNKFYRGKRWADSGTDGNGLGLYIAKMLMKKMNGDLTVENNGGLVITLIIPLS